MIKQSIYAQLKKILKNLLLFKTYDFNTFNVWTSTRTIKSSQDICQEITDEEAEIKIAKENFHWNAIENFNRLTRINQ